MCTKHGFCMIVCLELQVLKPLREAIDSTMYDKTPASRFMMPIKMPYRIWAWNEVDNAIKEALEAGLYPGLHSGAH